MKEREEACQNLSYKIIYIKKKKTFSSMCLYKCSIVSKVLLGSIVIRVNATKNFIQLLKA